MENIYQKSRDKVVCLNDFCQRYGITPENVAYIGDDLPDIGVMKICGLAVAPADAIPEVKEVCDYVSLYPGGKRVVRDLVEQVLKVHGKWEMDIDQYAAKF
jgi:3-deoxy-D-manno-octulosonate 8-phosphate phosphatase (KDO 8-P phosphatase)